MAAIHVQVGHAVHADGAWHTVTRVIVARAHVGLQTESGIAWYPSLALVDVRGLQSER